MNIIQAKHINSPGGLSGRAYTYKLPDGARIGAGAYVLVENRKTGAGWGQTRGCTQWMPGLST